MISKTISTSTKLAEASTFEKLLFTWIIPHCDDAGHLDASSKIVKGLVVPLCDESVDDVENALVNLQKFGLISFYFIDGRRYLEIEKWEDHQTFRPDRAIIKKYPTPFREYEIESDILSDLKKYEEGLEFVQRQFRINLPRSNHFRLIDILARDRNGKAVIIEVKREFVKSFTLEQQLCEYKDLYKNQTGEDSRLMIIAKGFDKDCIDLAKKLGIELKTYQSQTKDKNCHHKISKDKLSKDKLSKDISLAASKESAESKRFQELIYLFKDVNPSYQRLYSNKTQRAALYRLVKQHGFEKIEGTVVFLPKLIGKQYAPQITTPVQLEEKLGKLIAYVERRRAEIKGQTKTIIGL